ncbi:MAG: zinc-binding dehydrogenase, partial [Nitriliruptoraceae bacterium]
LHLGAEPVLAVDPVADRRDRAGRIGAAATSDPDGAQAALAELLAVHTTAPDPSGEVERRAPAVIDATGSASGQRLAFELTRPGGTLSIIAVQTAERFAFTPVETYDRNLTVRAGRASVRATLDTLLPEVAAGRFAVPSDTVVTHPEVPLEDGPELYRRFDAHEQGLVKAILRP